MRAYSSRFLRCRTRRRPPTHDTKQMIAKARLSGICLWVLGVVGVMWRVCSRWWRRWRRCGCGRAHTDFVRGCRGTGRRMRRCRVYEPRRVAFLSPRTAICGRGMPILGSASRPCCRGLVLCLSSRASTTWRGIGGLVRCPW